jgi:hypothetical protein
MLPFFVAAGVVEFDAWLSRSPILLSTAMLRRAVLAGAVFAVGYGMLTGAAVAYDDRAATQALVPLPVFTMSAQVALPELDSWQAAQAVAAIAKDAPAGTRFAMSEHGLPGALAPQIHIIDVLGLHDPYVARHGFSAAELFRRKPDFIWLPHPDHTQMLGDIMAAPELWADYDVYPDAFFYGIAIRREESDRNGLRQALFRQWHETYPNDAIEDHRAIR